RWGTAAPRSTLRAALRVPVAIGLTPEIVPVSVTACVVPTGVAIVSVPAADSKSPARLIRRAFCETHLPNAFRIAPAPWAFLFVPYVLTKACAPIVVRSALHAHAAFLAARIADVRGGCLAEAAAGAH